uniref:Uncharacterized protein n=1 Tax=Ophiognomonia clavigignenti-juglandacearum TaxID=218668 RepID=A0A291LJF7_9PEZI|nr:hypothetical protein [Ophiognomonia clavigignenti-juglandacearum]
MLDIKFKSPFTVFDIWSKSIFIVWIVTSSSSPTYLLRICRILSSIYDANLSKDTSSRSLKTKDLWWSDNVYHWFSAYCNRDKNKYLTSVCKYVSLIIQSLISSVNFLRASLLSSKICLLFSIDFIFLA